jgi:transcriptional regulator with XRE-family HTH domain
MKFGEFLKNKRLGLELSIRNLSRSTGIDVAYLSRIERGTKPPEKEEILDKLIKALNLNKTDARKLKDLAAIANRDIPDDIDISDENQEAIPVLLRTINNKKLTGEQIKELTKRINEEY